MLNHDSRAIRILFSATLLLTAIPLTANAADNRSATVRVDDLNLDSDAGRAVLKDRIDQAVVSICGDVHMRTTWALRAQAMSCSKAAHDGAMSQFDALVAAAPGDKKVASVR
jgi:UrcA family protein